MGLMDFFKSNRKSAPGSNLASARQAIFSLAQYSEDQNIREAALRHIRANLSDDKKYAIENQLRSLDPGTRAVAEGVLSEFDPSECEHDQAFLFDLSKSAFSNKDRLKAINQLSDQLDLMDIAINALGVQEGIGISALSRIVDQNLVFHIACKAKDNDVWRKAIDRITDQKILKKLARKSDFDLERAYVVQKLTDQKTLVKFALNDRDSSVRWAALVSIDNKSIWKLVARQDNDPSIRKYAVEKIDNQRVILKIANYDSDKQVRLDAIKKLEDKSALESLAKNDLDLDIRETAAYKLSDNKLIKQILYVKNAKHKKLKNEVISYAMEYFNSLPIVKMEKPLPNDSVQKGKLSDVLKMLDKNDKLSPRKDEDSRETWRRISPGYEDIYYGHKVDYALFTLNVRNYMNEGWVYDDITRIIIKRISDDAFMWYQETITMESN